RDWANKHRTYLKVQNPPPLSPSPFTLTYLLLRLIPYEGRTLKIENKMNREKLMKMANTVRTGGKGTVRRKKKAVHKTNTTDDKKLQSTLKRVGVNSIPGIEEVNIFKDDVVIQFINPKVQASVAANTWAVSGTPQTKKLQDILPQIISQLGTDNLDNLKKLAEQFQKQAPGGGADVPATIQEEDDDDDVPELVAGETFETPAAEEAAKATAP
uniref:Nascent polypeptide-associated complex subunit beta n=1 Tax=Brassica oleracea var. oleracea TaxID=109376 RepID=A0A0D3CWX9_BRAOL